MSAVVDSRYFLDHESDAVILAEHECDGVTVRVLEYDDYRWLKLGDQSIQSAMQISQPKRLVLPYFKPLLAGLLFQSQPENVLLLGLGGGELVRCLSQALPSARLMALDNNPLVIDNFRKYFNPQSIKLEIIEADACVRQAQLAGLFDLVFLDLYTDRALPTCFSDEVFYRLMRSYLTEQGVLAINLVVQDEQQAVSLLSLVRQRFDQHTLCLSVENHMNLIVLAFNKGMPDDLDKKKLSQRVDKLQSDTTLDLKSSITDLLKNLT